MVSVPQLRQAELRCGTTVTVCWIDPSVQQGDVVMLRDDEKPGRCWTAALVYSPAWAEPLREQQIVKVKL